MFEKGEISKGQTISPIRASVNWIFAEQHIFHELFEGTVIE